MPAINLQHNVEFSADQMRELVADVPNYLKFLPWVKAVKIWDKDEDGTSFKAELLIGYRNFRAPFATAVAIDTQSNIITTSLLKPKKSLTNLFTQPIKSLDCKWQFITSDKSSIVDLSINYEFNDKILAALLTNNLQKAIQKLIEAFTSEAKRRYS